MTIDRLILGADSQRETIQNIYHYASKIMYTVFSQRIEDFYQESFDLMNSFLFSLKSINENMMSIFMVALSIGSEDLTYYPQEVKDFIDNYLSYGKTTIINSHTLEMIYNTIDVFIPNLRDEDDDLYDEEFEAGCSIVDSLMLNAGNVVNVMNPNIVSCIIVSMSLYHCIMYQWSITMQRPRIRPIWMY